ncbi:MAG: M23 family metallopeptidase [Candidatus Taylorbacteria bacterium]|nr:M23 family metallopeptidase [Candidatus Taylorbacteria bacterium]
MQFLSKFSENKIKKSKTLCMKKVVLSILFTTTFISLSLIPLQTAQAGFFSLIESLAGDDVSAKTPDTTSVINSQNMLLLEAAVNIDPNPYKNDDYTILAYDNALFAEIGPQGTAYDVENKVSTEISLYTVHEGDTLSKVAQMFDVSVNTIIWANELGKNTTLKQGQMLVILPISGIRYTVKKGDTIKGIVTRYRSDLEEVLEYNDLTLLTVLKAGDVIIIPDAEPTAVYIPKIAQVRSTISNKAHDTKGPFYPGYYIRPIIGGIKSQDLHGYNGVDLAASVGTVIRASASGKVISSISNGAWNGGYGNYVIISHNNGTQTLYAHTQKNFVKVGDTVGQGEMIAKIGMTGKTTGAHVHFEIRGAKNPF